MLASLSVTALMELDVLEERFTAVKQFGGRYRLVMKFVLKLDSLFVA
jgi:hypothetical protein